MALREVGRLGRPVVHLRVDVDGVVAAPRRPDLVVPDALQVGRLRARPADWRSADSGRTGRAARRASGRRHGPSARRTSSGLPAAAGVEAPRSIVTRDIRLAWSSRWRVSSACHVCARAAAMCAVGARGRIASVGDAGAIAAVEAGGHRDEQRRVRGLGHAEVACRAVEATVGQHHEARFEMQAAVVGVSHRIGHVFVVGLDMRRRSPTQHERVAVDTGGGAQGAREPCRERSRPGRSQARCIATTWSG